MRILWADFVHWSLTVVKVSLSFSSSIWYLADNETIFWMNFTRRDAQPIIPFCLPTFNVTILLFVKEAVWLIVKWIDLLHSHLWKILNLNCPNIKSFRGFLSLVVLLIEDYLLQLSISEGKSFKEVFNWPESS